MRLTALVLMLGMAGAAHAVPIHWADWTASRGPLPNSPGANLFGNITTTTSTVNLHYNNPQGIAFSQITGGGVDYWQNNRSGRNPATSPYTSTQVDNIPTGTDIIALQFAGLQTLSFSQAIANPLFSFVSLNGNGYAFDRDFDILSVSGVDGNDCGYWGCGSVSKTVVDLGGGNFEYQLIGSGEPHGTIRFTGAFDTVTWRSLSNENWNGFTVGIEGTAEEVFGQPVPEPGTLVLLASGLVGLVAYGRRRRGA